MGEAAEQQNPFHPLWRQAWPPIVHALQPDGRTFCGEDVAPSGERVDRGTAMTCTQCRWAITKDRAKRLEAVSPPAEPSQDLKPRLYGRAYRAYLRTPEWQERRLLVLQRAGYICEGCLKAPATQVHHMSYEHCGDEFAWELRAVCDPCHDRYHGKGNP